ncbi:hypothetical protein FGO68_gene1235 [Halteria grandinella]|uniref:Uncharacterized protein n=1 Tax=Halteria grandinella TaxID=5974 RepID=A0A8J8NEW2_HALGN|nr:hypothetical protein FGO68_gene1235 [Halteria grandinella]
MMSSQYGQLCYGFLGYYLARSHQQQRFYLSIVSTPYSKHQSSIIGIQKGFHQPVSNSYFASVIYQFLQY